jgi:hypothetical protein
MGAATSVADYQPRLQKTNADAMDSGGTAAQSATATNWIVQANLAGFLPDLRAKAEASGMAAAWVQNDPQQHEGFLVVAANATDAQAINGYFYWLGDQTAAGRDSRPLLLGLDRLFTEKGRAGALAKGQYSEPAVVSLLDYSLRLVLAGQYDPGIPDFILDCYRQDFARRLAEPADLADKNWSRRINGIEVIYNASIFSSVVFKVAA